MTTRVLVADDDRDLLETVAESLSATGATVLTASTGAELLERVAEEEAFDLVITDLSMPWMTGLQVAQSMVDVGLRVPMIVMTGQSDASLPGRIRALGGHVSLLFKPFDLEELRTAISLRLPTIQWATRIVGS